jgi:hypothetical protein
VSHSLSDLCQRPVTISTSAMAVVSALMCMPAERCLLSAGVTVEEGTLGGTNRAPEGPSSDVPTCLGSLARLAGQKHDAAWLSTRSAGVTVEEGT